MDQYIYKTFKMLQNGLYWSFYCSSIWIFVQTVEGRREEEGVAEEVEVGRDFRSRFFKMDNASASGHLQHADEAPPPPTSTPTGR